jgi:hypothetical protein
MTCYCEKKLYSFINGPPRDILYRIGEIRTRYVTIDFVGLGEIDTSLYKRICIIFGDFSDNDDASIDQMTRTRYGDPVYFVRVKLANQLSAKDITATTNINWEDAVTNILRWTYRYHSYTRESKLIIAGIGIEGGRYASELFDALERTVSTHKLVSQLVIQSGAVYSVRVQLLSGMGCDRISIVAPYPEGADRDQKIAFRDKLARTPYMYALIYAIPDGFSADDQLSYLIRLGAF